MGKPADNEPPVAGTEPLARATEPYGRVRDVSVEMYGPDVAHPKYPALALRVHRHPGGASSNPGSIDLWICDDWDALADLGRLITRKAEARKAGTEL
jgi:hypothetical protein